MLRISNIQTASTQGPREYQQDRLLVKGNLFAVADGMGGHLNGEKAAQTAIDFLAEMHPGETSSTLSKANRAIYHAGDGRGTTVVAAEVNLEKSQVEINWCGDSRAYLLRAGICRALTQDQGRGHILYKFLGTYDYGGLCTYFDLEAGDTILLTTDGVHDYLSLEKMQRMLNQNKTMTEILECIERATKDNSTIIRFDLVKS